MTHATRSPVRVEYEQCHQGAPDPALGPTAEGKAHLAWVWLQIVAELLARGLRLWSNACVAPMRPDQRTRFKNCMSVWAMTGATHQTGSSVAGPRRLHVNGQACARDHQIMPRSKLMTYKMLQLRAFALVFGLVPLASASWALAQPAAETQQITPPPGDATRTDPERRGGQDSAMERRRGIGEDDRRLGGRFEPNDDGDRLRFNRWSRDRDDGRDRGRWRGRGFDLEENDWIRPPTMGYDRMTMSDGWLMRICSPDGDRVVTFMLERLERITQPTDTQRAAFDSLKNATARASEMARAACPTEQAITPPGRLAAAEKRLEALLQAVRTVRPAMDAFYGSLTDEQKARLSAFVAAGITTTVLTPITDPGHLPDLIDALAP